MSPPTRLRSSLSATAPFSTSFLFITVMAILSVLFTQHYNASAFIMHSRRHLAGRRRHSATISSSSSSSLFCRSLPRWKSLPFISTSRRERFLSRLYYHNNNNNDPAADEDTTNTSSLLPERAKLLPQVLRYRGTVDKGYGRGGKQLGVPTANLPSSLFAHALQDIATGVYFGWALLENQDTVYKTVVNVGYSPTFEGQENKEKIIEAHLIVESETESSSSNNDDDSSAAANFSLPDFYGVPMRLQLLGFLRDEQKFDSFPALVAQIQQDVQDAKMALDHHPYVTNGGRCDRDFFDPSTMWVGSSGGDETASWQVQDMNEFLQTLKEL
jgi:riboflavin kinase